MLGIIVEVQLRIDDAKLYSWPHYATSLRLRLSCPTCVLVYTLDDKVARWAATPVSCGPAWTFAPIVGPAMARPELALLSVLAKLASSSLTIKGWSADAFAAAASTGHGQRSARASSARLHTGPCLPGVRFRPSHLLGDEPREWLDVAIHAGAFQRREILVSIVDPDHGPWVSAARQQRVHHEARDATIAIGKGMDVPEEPVAKHRTDRRFGLLLDEVEQRRHRLAQEFPSRRNMPRSAQVHRMVSIAREHGRAEE